MSILSLNGPTGRPARSKRAVKVWMGIGMVIAVLGVGSTLASTITINSDNNTEFGQGVQRTVYCGGDKEITVKPISSYIDSETVSSNGDESNHRDDNAEPTPVPTAAPGYFYLSGIAVSDIPAECSGVNFVISVYSVGGSAPITISSYDNPVVRVITPTVLWKRTETQDLGILSLSRDLLDEPNPDNNPALSAPYLTVGTHSSATGSFVIHFNSNPNITNTDINNVGRILIETQDNAFEDGGTPVVGARIRRS